MGNTYRLAIRVLGIKQPITHCIGGYGPFLMDGMFAFSDFKNWGNSHNRGFSMCVEACRGKECVFDIGAHIGLVSLPVSAVLNKNGSVYAFEPAEANLRLFLSHIKLNNIKNIKVVPSLVGEATVEQQKFFERTGVTGQNTVAPVKDRSLYHEINRHSYSLDEYCAEHGLVPEVVKIDVEGSELAVLKGGMKIIQSAK